MNEEQQSSGAPVVPDITQLSPEQVTQEMLPVIDALELSRGENGCVTFGSGTKRVIVFPEGIDDPDSSNNLLFVAATEGGFKGLVFKKTYIGEGNRLYPNDVQIFAFNSLLDRVGSSGGVETAAPKLGYIMPGDPEVQYPDELIVVADGSHREVFSKSGFRNYYFKNITDSSLVDRAFNESLGKKIERDQRRASIPQLQEPIAEGARASVTAARSILQRIGLKR